jgi:hypothetical protein
MTEPIKKQNEILDIAEQAKSHQRQQQQSGGEKPRRQQGDGKPFAIDKNVGYIS